MKARVLDLVALAAGIAAASCTEPLAPVVSADSVTLEFTYWRSSFEDSVGPRVLGGSGKIALWGRIEEQGHCGEVSAHVFPWPTDKLTIEIVQDYAPSPTPCNRRYELILQGLPPGRHALRVRQVQDDLDWGRTTEVFDGVVRVF